MRARPLPSGRRFATSPTTSTASVWRWASVGPERRPLPAGTQRITESRPERQPGPRHAPGA